MKSKFVATNDESVSAEMINRFVQEDAYQLCFLEMTIHSGVSSKTNELV